MVSLIVGAGSAFWLVFGLRISGVVDSRVAAAAALTGSLISAAAVFTTFLRRQIFVPIDGNAEEKDQWVRVRVKSSPFSRDAEQSYFYSPSVLARSPLLRTTLRKRFGLALDLGADSPEILRPRDPPIAEWQPISALPEPVEGGRGSSVYRTNAGGPGVLLEPFDESAARFLRKTATFATTVVDEAALDDERLYVREGKDVASMDLALLRGAAPLGDGHVVFSFGKFTTVVFPDASASKIVRALRDCIPRRSEVPAPAAAAFEEVAEVQEVEEEAGSGARAKSTAR